MKIKTERDLILSVAEDWKTQRMRWSARHWEPVYSQLLALDLTTASAQEVNSIIGYDSWTSFICDECDEKCNWVIELGEEPGCESATANICRECFSKAVALVGEVK